MEVRLLCWTLVGLFSGSGGATVLLAGLLSER